MINKLVSGAFPFVLLSTYPGPERLLMTGIYFSFYAFPDVVRGQHGTPHQVYPTFIYSFDIASHSQMVIPFIAVSVPSLL